MKYVILLSLILFSIDLLAQSDVQLFKTMGISIEDIEAKTVSIDCSNYANGYRHDDEELDVYKLLSIFNLNIYEYYNLNNVYDTELKKKAFEKTSEYAEKLSELKELKDSLKHEVLSVEIMPYKLSDYDLEKKEFSLKFYTEGRPPKTICGISSRFLNIKKVIGEQRAGITAYMEEVPLTTDEEQALKIENNKGDVSIILLFKIDRKERIKYDEYWDMDSEDLEKVLFGQTILKKEITSTVLIPKYIRLLVINKFSGEIYFDNVYTSSGIRNKLGEDKKIKKIKEQGLLNEIERQKALKEKYDSIIKKADNAFKIKQWDVSKDYYKEAVTVLDKSYAKMKIKEVNRILDFLEERRTTTYRYSQLEPDYYKEYISLVNEAVKKIVKETEVDTFNVSLMLKAKVDTNGRNNHEITFTLSDNKMIEESIKNEIVKFPLKPAYKNGYAVNASLSELIFFSIDKSTYELIYNDEGIILESGDIKSYVKHERNIKYLIEQYPKGTYEVDYTVLNFNGVKEEKVNIINYKDFGGAGYSLMSLMLPGVGDYFVNQGKGSLFGENISPMATTVSTLGLIGSGIYLKTKSNKFYDRYLTSTKQSEINKYYKTANELNKSSLVLLGFGGILWLTDIYWVIKKGRENTKEGRALKRKMSWSLHPSVDNKYSLLSLKIKF